jgi:hypothetical protein
VRALTLLVQKYKYRRGLHTPQRATQKAFSAQKALLYRYKSTNTDSEAGLSVRDSEGILGRDPVIEELRAVFVHYVDDRERRGHRGPGRLVVISGQAGIGKATILRRFLGLILDNPSKVRIFKASADAVENKTPYYPWKKILAGLLGVDRYTKLPCPEQFTCFTSTKVQILTQKATRRRQVLNVLALLVQKYKY